MMKHTLAIIFAFCALALTAQEEIKVKYSGSKPSISDFTTSLLAATTGDDEEDCTNESGNAMAAAWDKYRKGLPLDKGDAITVDAKNGYVRYENKYEEFTLVIEICYWNEADKKHKLVAYNVTSYSNGVSCVGQFDGITFYRYNNATKKMKYVEGPGMDRFFNSSESAHVTFSLPRSGKDIKVSYWQDNKVKSQKTLKWNGKKFVY